METAMFSLALSAALTFAAAAPDPVIPTRKAYSSCINKTISEHVDKKAEPAVFNSAVKGACSAQEASLRDALIKSDIARGFKRKDAEEGAGLQIADYLAVAQEEYPGYLESNTKPQ